jgi:hypothetical protein
MGLGSHHQHILLSICKYSKIQKYLKSKILLVPNILNRDAQIVMYYNSVLILLLLTPFLYFPHSPFSIVLIY